MYSGGRVEEEAGKQRDGKEGPSHVSFLLVKEGHRHQALGDEAQSRFWERVIRYQQGDWLRSY